MRTPGKPPLSVGVIGLGKVAQEHLKGYAASSYVVVTAACDIDPASRERTRSLYGCRVYSSTAEMLDAHDLDIACVLTPPASHRTIVEQALSRNVHVLCEKPVASSLEDAIAIRDLAENAQTAFLFGASYRHLPAMKEARKRIKENELGKIRLCVETGVGGAGLSGARTLGETHYPKGGPGGTPMGVVDHGVHIIDAFSWLMNADIEQAFGRGNISGETPLAEYATLMFSNGAVGQLLYDEGTFSASPPSEGVFSEGAGWNVNGPVAAGGWDSAACMLSIHGTDGAIRIYPYANLLLLEKAGQVTNIRLPALAAPNHFRTQIESFVRTITMNEPAAATANDGLAAQATLEAVYKSAEERRVVALSELT